MTASKKDTLKDFNNLLKLRFSDELKDLILFGTQVRLDNAINKLKN